VPPETGGRDETTVSRPQRSTARLRVADAQQNDKLLTTPVTQAAMKSGPLSTRKGRRRFWEPLRIGNHENNHETGAVYTRLP
jgi:hypothetical protein